MLRSSYTHEKLAEFRERELQQTLKRRFLLDNAGPARASRIRSGAIRFAALVAAAFRAS